MPVKKDDAGNRRVEMEFLAPGTPEQIWDAMATGPGNATWFTKATIEPRVGGKLMFHFGPDTTTSGEVTAWEPPRRFGYVEREWNPGAPPVATEITITPHSGGQCVVRMVHSLFATTDDWDDQLESFENGWPGFFEVLRIYVRHFAGLEAVSAMTMTTVAGETLDVWRRITRVLGLSDAHAGEHRVLTSAPQPVAGVIERIHQDAGQRYIVVRLDQPTAGVAIVGAYRREGKTTVSITRFLYGPEQLTSAALEEERWSEWLNETLAKDAQPQAARALRTRS